MIRKIVLFLAILTMANAAPTETTTTFGAENAIGNNEYGDSIISEM